VYVDADSMIQVAY